MEKLHLALLLAGTRAAIERKAVHVAPSGEGFELTTGPHPGDGGWITVGPSGAMVAMNDRRSPPRILGNVSSLVSTK